MKLFKNVLVYQPADRPVSGALRIACRLSRQMGSQVKVVDVRHHEHAWWQEIIEDTPLAFQVDVSEQEDYLNVMADEVGFEPDNIQIKVLEGRPIEALINESLAAAHDLILKDIDSVSENLFFGSLDLRLLRLAPAPVWLVDGNVPAKTNRILAAVDPHVRGDEMEMNERIIRLASLLARQDSAELYVVSAWHTPSAAFENGGDEFQRYTAAKNQIRQRAWENVEHVVESSLLQIPPERVLFEQGVPSEAIVLAVQQLQPDLLVMGSVTQRGIPGLWIGNTAEEVSRQVTCSILSVKPKDFQFLLSAQPGARG